jgi:hypothetical protein
MGRPAAVRSPARPRLLTSNLPAAERSRLTASGDNAIIGILLRIRAIIGSPKWA